MELYIEHAGSILGPIPLDRFAAFVAKNGISMDQKGWHEGMAVWVPLKAIPAVVAKVPPPTRGMADNPSTPPPLPQAKGSGTAIFGFKVPHASFSDRWSTTATLIGLAGGVMGVIVWWQFFNTGNFMKWRMLMTLPVCGYTAFYYFVKFFGVVHAGTSSEKTKALVVCLVVAAAVIFLGFAASGMIEEWGPGVAFLVALMVGPVSGYAAVKPKQN